MLYMIWMQDYDYAGVTLVDGPEDADIQGLKKEYLALHNKSYEEYKEESRKLWKENVRKFGEKEARKMPGAELKGFAVKYNRWKDIDGVPFADTGTYGFVCWLVEEKKGFSHVEVQREEY